MHGNSGRWLGTAVIVMGMIAALPFYRHRRTVELPRAVPSPRHTETPVADARPLQVEWHSVQPEFPEANSSITAGADSDKPQVTREAALPKHDPDVPRDLVPLPSLPRNYVAVVPVPSPKDGDLPGRGDETPAEPTRGSSRKGKTRSLSDEQHGKATRRAPLISAETRVALRDTSDRRDDPARDGEGRKSRDVEKVVTHRIVDGDSLAGLAKRYLGSPQLAEALFEANRDVLSDPDLLPLGRKLRIPLALAESFSVDHAPGGPGGREAARHTAAREGLRSSPAAPAGDLVPLTYEQRMALKARWLNSMAERQVERP